MITPVRTHAPSNAAGDPTARAIPADTMKMPDPIMDPTASSVASVTVIAAMKPSCAATRSFGIRQLYCDAPAAGRGRAVAYRALAQLRRSRLQ